ncbi:MULTISPECIES: asparagine synthase (glutamine-hydrolyzing) [Bacillus amyloliquefaciens group]|uniref:asparagine synthase (glutamine-hydrolyzing) n=1 Tax=Bacillus amyloliquefaciens group TaxID=1938374 RepID=UPI0003A9E865|nr:asparagine synthase (glutamine-hydrolyzing) [Bacillus velezensis]AUJ61249.1 asparagine synthase (glutamine-hydrolyzing) [Bacillus velezensis]
MCGIFGFLNNFHGDKQDLITKQHNLIKHRGPDDFKYFMNSIITMGSVRLSITDIDNGSQPFQDDMKQVTCFYNGEIYNYKELKNELEEKGYRFNTNCDGEVIPSLYLEYGEKFFEKLDGMYSICLFDKKSEVLLLAVDPYSIKSIYYYTDGEHFAFSSEIKALSALPFTKFEIDEKLIFQYLFYKAIFPPETIFKNIFKLRPGTFLKVTNGVLRENEYHKSKLDSPSQESLEEALDKALNKSINEMIPEEVSYGCLLSGGLDSSIIVSYLHKNRYSNFNIYSIGYSGQLEDDERKFAQNLTKKLGLTLNEVILKPEEIPLLLNKVIYSLEEPIQDPITIPTYKVIKEASKKNRVLLTGDGSDELFGGYSRYKSMLKNGLSGYRDSIGTMTKSQFMNFFKLNHWFNDGYSILKNDTKLEDLMELEQVTRLPAYHLVRLDKLSMSHSIEARVPFLRNNIANLARLSRKFKDFITLDNEKIFLKNAVRNTVPKNIVSRRKKPFTLPINIWIKNELFDFVESILSSGNAYHLSFCDKKSIDLLLKEHREGLIDHSHIIWSLVILENFIQFTKDLNLNKAAIEKGTILLR